MFDMDFESLDEDKVHEVVLDWGEWIKAELSIGTCVFLRSDDDVLAVFTVQGDGSDGALYFVESLEETKALQNEFKLKVSRAQGGEQ